MERESNSSMDSLCRSGCGFYGSQATDGLCSICYKELLKKKQRPPSSSTSSTAFSFSGGLPSSSSNSLSIIPTLSSSNNEETVSHHSEAAVNQQQGEKVAENALAASDHSEDKDSKPKKKNRCGICKKKLGLTGFECRCGGLYCGVHRYSDKHECTFDYRQLGAQEIRKNNPVVVGEKIRKI